MSTLSIRLPDSLHRYVKELAEREGVSMNQFIALAVAEKVSALKTVDYLEERAQRGSREKFERVLSKVPDVEPEEYDPRGAPSHPARPFVEIGRPQSARAVTGLPPPSPLRSRTPH